MPTTKAWSSSSRVLDDKWHGAQLAAHRERLAAIESAACVSTHALSSALARDAAPVRVRKGARAASPAVKARQKQIERENLVLIKKIVAIDRAKPGGRKPKLRDTVVVRSAVDHECQPRPASASAASHALYTRRSATMERNFAELNAPTIDRSADLARRRSRAQRRVMDENCKLLQRILTARTSFSRSTWRQHEEEHLRLRATISKHPPPRQLVRAQTSRTTLCGGDDCVVVFRHDDRETRLFPDKTERRRSLGQRPLSASSSTSALGVSTERSHIGIGCTADSVVARMRRLRLESAVLADDDGEHVGDTDDLDE